MGPETKFVLGDLAVGGLYATHWGACPTQHITNCHLAMDVTTAKYGITYRAGSGEKMWVVLTPLKADKCAEFEFIV